jgi:predicted RNase H-like HicB family nuclease
MTTTYRVSYEMASDGSWSASATDLPVFSAGETREEAEREIQQAIRIYLDEMANRDTAAPAAHCITGTVAV